MNQEFEEHQQFLLIATISLIEQWTTAFFSIARLYELGEEYRHGRRH